MSLEEYKKIYDEKGIVIIPGVFLKFEIEKMRGSAIVAINTPNEQYRHKYLEIRNEFPSLLFWPSFTNYYLNEVRKDQRIAEIVRYFLGDNVKQLNNQIYFRFPGDGDQFAWHQDVTFRKPKERYTDIESSYLQTIIAIDDITLENSPVEFIEGSQKWGEHDLTSKTGVNEMLRVFKRHGLEGKKYLCKAGDMVLWSVMTVHGSEPNNSDRTRMTYMNGFAKADSAFDWPIYLKDGEVQDADPKLIP